MCPSYHTSDHYLQTVSAVQWEAGLHTSPWLACLDHQQRPGTFCQLEGQRHPSYVCLTWTWRYLESDWLLYEQKSWQNLEDICIRNSHLKQCDQSINNSLEDQSTYFMHVHIVSMNFSRLSPVISFMYMKSRACKRVDLLAARTCPLVVERGSCW